MAGWLNYHHLLYFWTVVRTGSLNAAAKELHISQPTISTQLKLLDEAMGQKLLEKQGRRLVLTEVGKTAFRFADEIFRLGKELTRTMEHRSLDTHVRLSVGIADVVPKMIAERLLRPAFQAAPGIRLECTEGAVNGLLSRLAIHELDVVIADAPAPPEVKIRAFNHPLGETGVTFFAAGPRAATLKKGFPQSLDGSPALLPTLGASSRRQLEQYFDGVKVRPLVVGEFDDSALLCTFGQEGVGFFAAPTAIAPFVSRQYGVEAVGATTEVKERYYAITVERRLRHPGVVAIAESARNEIFA